MLTILLLAWFKIKIKIKRLTGKYFSTREKFKNPIMIHAISVRRDITTMKGTK